VFLTSISTIIFLGTKFQIFHFIFVSMLFTIFPSFQPFQWSIHIKSSQILSLSTFNWFMVFPRFNFLIFSNSHIIHYIFQLSTSLPTHHYMTYFNLFYFFTLPSIWRQW
jgi:hypothetical protein